MKKRKGGNFHGAQKPKFEPNFSEARIVGCPECKGRAFQRGCRFFLLPKVALSNPSGQDLILEKAGFLCLGCQKFFESPPGSEELGGVRRLEG